MKYLLVLAVIAIAFWFWFWRQARRPGIGPKPPPPSGTPQAMARCAHCGLHLPAADTVAGKQGVYCSAAHRLLEEP